MMNNAAFGKTMENVRKHWNIKLVTSERRRNYLVSEPNYHTKKFFAEDLLAMEIRKAQILMNKLVCLTLSISDLTKTAMHEFWCNYVTKIWWKGKTFLYGYRQLHCSCKNLLD